MWTVFVHWHEALEHHMISHPSISTAFQFIITYDSINRLQLAEWCRIYSDLAWCQNHHWKCIRTVWQPSLVFCTFTWHDGSILSILLTIFLAIEPETLMIAYNPLLQVDELDLFSIGPKFEKNPVFPARTNTEVIFLTWSLKPAL